MKTKFHFLFIFAFLIFLSASGQKSASIQSGKVSSASGTTAFVSHINPVSDVISDLGKNILQPELDRLLDSVYDFDWASSDWSLKSKNHKSHNANGWLTEDLYVVKNQGTGLWSNYVHYLYSYTGSDPDYTRLVGELWTSSSSWLAYEYTHNMKKAKPDTTYTKNWNPQKQKFVSGTKKITVYDTLDAPTEILTQRYDTTSGGWINQYRNLTVYVAPHLLSEEIFQNWNAASSAWNNINRKTESYDTSNFLLEHMEYVWSDTANAWQNSSRITYVNNEEGKPVTSLTETWNGALQAWQPLKQSIFSYSPLGWILNEREQTYNPETSVYEDSYLTYFTYFTSGILQSTTGNFWKPLTNEWITDTYHLIDSNLKLVEEFVRYHDNTTYEIIGGSRTAETYSSKLQLTNQLNQAWSKTTSDWINLTQTNYSYNVYKLLEEEILQDWDTIAGSWLNNRRSLYYYSEPFSINDTRNDKSLCKFANPIKSGAVINCPGFSEGANYTLKIFSLSGAMVYSQGFTGGNSVTLATNLPDGLYMMQFASQEGKVLSTSKVLILR